MVQVECVNGSPYAASENLEESERYKNVASAVKQDIEFKSSKNVTAVSKIIRSQDR